MVFLINQPRSPVYEPLQNYFTYNSSRLLDAMAAGTLGLLDAGRKTKQFVKLLFYQYFQQNICLHP